MDGGKRPEIARQAGEQSLAWDGEEDEEPVKGTEVKVGKGEVGELHKGQTALSSSQSAPASPDTIKIEIKGKGEPIEDTREQASPDTIGETEIETEREPVEDMQPTMYSTATCIDGLHEQPSPDTIVKPEISTPESELLPILQVPRENPTKRRRTNRN
jgi:hypothetical protein